MCFYFYVAYEFLSTVAFQCNIFHWMLNDSNLVYSIWKPKSKKSQIFVPWKPADLHLSFNIFVSILFEWQEAKKEKKIIKEILWYYFFVFIESDKKAWSVTHSHWQPTDHILFSRQTKRSNPSWSTLKLYNVPISNFCIQNESFFVWESNY